MTSLRDFGTNQEVWSGQALSEGVPSDELVIDCL